VESKGGVVYDFYVVGFPIGSSSAQINLWINNDMSWAKIVISYIISSRKDLFLGSFPVLTYPFLNSPNNTFLYKYGLPNWTNPTSPVSSVAQFAGFRTSIPNLQSLKINSAIIDTSSGFLSINITADTNFTI
jgi:hypothetical protein